ncbi:MAG: hypothetical protein IKU55_02780, partial [Clostridia bacterium]|nr:hypothetical protein [Clostridia bacterium]
DSFQGYLFDKPCSANVLEAKYFISNTAEYAERLNQIDRLRKEKSHAPIINMETKAILRGISMGLWIIRINNQTGEGELYTDDTMRRLLGVSDEISPDECFKHWQNNIDNEHRSAVDDMIREMTENNDVIQVEYPWYHPQKNRVIVRCSGRCTEKDDEVSVFEGFHRIISGF